MRIDFVARRGFPVIVGAFVAAAAFFQALGLGTIVAASTLPSGPRPASSHAPKESSPVSRDDAHATSAAAIVERNPFDSTTGPLDGAPRAATDVTSDEAPKCPATRAVLIAAADDEAWSFAAFNDGKTTTLARVGDAIAGAKLVEIDWRRAVLERDGARCQVRLGDKLDAPAIAAGAPASKPSSTLEDILSKIQRSSSGEISIERSALETALAHQGELFGHLRIAPQKDGDRVLGLRVDGIKPDSLPGKLGLQNGDRLTSVNGFDIADPRAALEAYARLRYVDHLSVALVRSDKPTSIEVSVK